MSRVVFVTGATGFIGGAVARRFALGGYEVYGLTRTADKSKSLLQNEINPVIGEVNKPETYEKILKKASVVVHCASGVSQTPFDDDKAILEATARLSATSSTKKLFILTSGCLIYGGKISSDTYFNEDYELDNVHPWIEWRKKIEALVVSSSDFIGAVARPGFLYGGSGSYTGPFFSMAESKKLVVSGNPEKKWAFVHFADLAEGYYLIAEAPRSIVKGEVFNFGDGTRSTLREVVIAAGKAAGCEGEVTYVPAGNDFVGQCAEQSCILDCTKAKKLLGWVPKHYGFVENISRYYTAWKAHQK